jgi:hypothetical protein
MLDGPGLKYYWHPKSNCSLPESQYRAFDVEDFCDLMKGRGPLMVVGDSVSELSALSFKNLILSKTSIRNCTQFGAEGPLDTTTGYHVPNVFPTCQNLHIYQMRDDYLSVSSSAAYTAGNRTDYNTFTWTENIGFLNVSVLLLNRGSHYVEDALLLPQVNETLHFITTRFPNVHVIWRNTPHGHLLYKNFVLAHPLPRIPANLNMYDESPEHNPWGYGHFRRQNNLVRDLLQKHYPQVLYLDVFNPTILRADSRYNAIHPCVPGVYDTWLEMIYNALVLLWRYSVKVMFNLLILFLFVLSSVSLYLSVAPLFRVFYPLSVAPETRVFALTQLDLQLVGCSSQFAPTREAGQIFELIVRSLKAKALKVTLLNFFSI